MSSVCDLFFMRPKRIFRKHIVFSCVCDFFFFFFFFFLDVCMFVDTKNLERLIQSKPNFHT